MTGTRWTRWVPLSNFSRDQAPSPSTRKLISLRPPSSVSLRPTTSSRQPRLSTYRAYMRKRSAAKSMASSPPTPPRISITTFRLSLGSLGSSRSFSSSRSRSISAFASRISSWAISRSSGSSSRTWAEFSRSSARRQAR